MHTLFQQEKSHQTCKKMGAKQMGMGEKKSGVGNKPVK